LSVKLNPIQRRIIGYTYSEEEIDALIFRWDSLLDLGDSSPEDVSHCRTFQELLSYRLKSINEIMKSALSVVTTSREYDKKTFDSLRGIWMDRCHDQFQRLFLELKKYGFIGVTPNSSKIPYDFRMADLTGICFAGARLFKADFSGALCTSSSFLYASCNKAIFTAAMCSNSIFDHAQCANAYFIGIIGLKTSFIGCNSFEADYSEAQCLYSCFNGAMLKRVKFDSANLSSVSFNSANLREATFSECILFQTDFTRANISNCDFKSVKKLRKIILFEAHIDQSTSFPITIPEHIEIFDSLWYKNRKINKPLDHIYDSKYISVCRTYQAIYMLMRSKGFYHDAGAFYYKFRKSLMGYNKCFKKGSRKSRMFEFVQFYLMGFGEKPARVLLWIFGIILLFGYFYSVNPSYPLSILDSMYFSSVTFLTLGFGDVYPITSSCKIIAPIEAFIGFILCSLYTVTIARKLIRD